jgi:putative restriction endonuclease|tara:strand:+ start:38 stop:916 length:879 start_codon:yes stop_codon:yes gene_type:complete
MDVHFGSVKGIKIGQIFKNRKELRDALIHAPLQSGIWGGSITGACSIVLSGGYEDDIDELDFILYTGHGGQNNKRQVSDQYFNACNEGLRISAEFRLPVRVTRGFQIKNGPNTGYRYDGLYFIEKYERVRGKSGFFVCRFHLKSQIDIEELEKNLSKNLRSDYQRSPRQIINLDSLIRKKENTARIKLIYKHTCQVCQKILHTPDGNPISIGAHIKPLGRPANGPDILENMLCLCPNHHDQFDRYSFYIDPNDYSIKGLDSFLPNKIKIDNRHKIDKSFLKFHYEEFKKRNN